MSAFPPAEKLSASSPRWRRGGAHFPEVRLRPTSTRRLQTSARGRAPLSCSRHAAGRVAGLAAVVPAYVRRGAPHRAARRHSRRRHRQVVGARPLCRIVFARMRPRGGLCAVCFHHEHANRDTRVQRIPTVNAGLSSARPRSSIVAPSPPALPPPTSSWPPIKKVLCATSLHLPPLRCPAGTRTARTRQRRSAVRRRRRRRARMVRTPSTDPSQSPSFRRRTTHRRSPAKWNAHPRCIVSREHHCTALSAVCGAHRHRVRAASSSMRRPMLEMPATARELRNFADTHRPWANVHQIWSGALHPKRRAARSGLYELQKLSSRSIVSWRPSSLSASWAPAPYRLCRP